MTAQGPDLVALTDQPIDGAQVRAHLNKGPADQRGGVCVFEGCTRSERHPEHGALILLEYSAYEAMALRQMQDLVTAARRRWPIGAAALVHRTGSVAVGEPSVMIAVACPHRAEAFEACRWLIDQLKRDVPIWKKEIWDSSAETWSQPE